MSIYYECPKGDRLTVKLRRVETSTGAVADLRLFIRNNPREAELPAVEGVIIPMHDVPALRAALQRLEFDAVSDGSLTADAYLHASLPLPAILAREYST